MPHSHHHNFERYILVTGAAGQVGSCLVDRLIENPQNFVVAVDNFLTGKRKIYHKIHLLIINLLSAMSMIRSR